MNEFLYILSLQPAAWRVVIAIVFALACAFSMGGLFWFATWLCDDSLGPLSLTVRIWQPRRQREALTTAQDDLREQVRTRTR